MTRPIRGYTLGMADWIWILIAAAVVVVLIVLAVVLISRARQRRHTSRLRSRCGPEYDSAVKRFGRAEGERHLEERLEQHESRRYREVDDEERDAALQAWDAVQLSFVDSPVGALRTADQLVYDVLRERGFPMETLDDRASAMSVESPELAHRYRTAHAELAQAETTDTRDVGRLRDAFLTYRDVLGELVGAPAVEGRLSTRPDGDRDVEPDGDRDVERDAEPEPIAKTEDQTWTSTRTGAT